MFLVVVFSHLSAYLHVCVLWAMLSELNKMHEMNEFNTVTADCRPELERQMNERTRHALALTCVTGLRGCVRGQITEHGLK